jgi:hypothetical protein
MEDDKLNYIDYCKFVQPQYVDTTDLGKWVQFKDSYPILIGKQTFIEVLCDDGNPTIHSIWLGTDNTVRIRDFDFHRELLIWHLEECMELYWRYMPDPPGNCGYSVG